MAVPFFMRGKDENGRDFVDFTVAINISMGGLLLASRHAVPRAAKVSLEIPASPQWKFKFPTRSLRSFKASVIRATTHGQYKLYGLRFTPSLAKSSTPLANLQLG